MPNLIRNDLKMYHWYFRIQIVSCPPFRVNKSNFLMSHGDYLFVEKNILS